MNEPTPSRRRRLLSIALELVLLLALVEVGVDFLRFARKTYLGLAARTSTSREARWEPDDYLRGRIVPSQKDVFAGASLASFNSLGFRGPEPRPAPHRIVCLGDSVTFGWGASRDETSYPAVLGRMLAAHGADVVNAGMPRWNSCDLMDLYVARIIPLRPHLLVFLAGWNDIGYEFPVAKRPSPSAIGIVGRAASESYSSARVAGALLDRLSSAPDPDSVIKDRESGKDLVRWERFDEYERILASTVQLARLNGSQPVLVTLPHFLSEGMSEKEKRRLLPHLLLRPDLSYSGWRRMVLAANGRIRKVSTALGVPLADCERSVPFETFTDLCHYNDEGYRRLAACVARTVEPLLAARGGSGAAAATPPEDGRP